MSYLQLVTIVPPAPRFLSVVHSCGGLGKTGLVGIVVGMGNTWGGMHLHLLSRLRKTPCLLQCGGGYLVLHVSRIPSPVSLESKLRLVKYSTVVPMHLQSTILGRSRMTSLIIRRTPADPKVTVSVTLTLL